MASVKEYGLLCLENPLLGTSPDGARDGRELTGWQTSRPSVTRPC